MKLCWNFYTYIGVAEKIKSKTVICFLIAVLATFCQAKYYFWITLHIPANEYALLSAWTNTHLLRLASSLSKKILHNIALRFIIIWFFINVQIMGQYPYQCAPFQVAGFLNAWQISKKLGCLSNQSNPSGHMKKKLPHQADDVKITSYWHQCDVFRSNWRQYDVILTSYIC